MLAFMAMPELSCPLAPQGVVEVDPGQGAVDASGVFSMLRGKLNPPLSRSLYKSHTAWVVKLSSSLAATAAVQLAYNAQKDGFIAVSKNGCFGNALKNAA